ncbi:hypothetical protein NQ314_006467, partial [Rhamnusium bicolor]
KHEKEDSVREIMQVPKGDKKRKQMINLLRKEGNFTLLDENKIRPVQRSIHKDERQEDNEVAQEFMPCPYCKGIYRLTTVRKHSKTSSRVLFLDKLRLKNEVFPNMHADRASFYGKNDPVICQHAEDYLRKHKRPHIKNAVSNKIRELGRLLTSLEEIYGLNTMLQAMNTKHFDKVVHAAQIISGYDATSKTFQAPSLALHMKTILLTACLAAKTILLKQEPILPVGDYKKALKNVKEFRMLIDERWKFDMGSLVLKDIHEKQGAKPRTLPITSDVIKFRQYAVNIAEQSMVVLRENINDLPAFKKLTEATLALTILLNRKRATTGCLTAKIAKLLIMMDKGEGADYQGKTLEEIDIHLENLNEENPERMDSDTGTSNVEHQELTEQETEEKIDPEKENEDHGLIGKKN